MDGGLEIDGSNRQNIDPSPEEPLGHIAAEGDKATPEIVLCGMRTVKFISLAVTTLYCLLIDSPTWLSKLLPCSTNLVVTWTQVMLVIYQISCLGDLMRMMQLLPRFRLEEAI